MHWPSYVEKTFYQFCAEQKNCPPNLLAALKNSPRTTMFLKNLSEEISKAERLVHKRRGRPLKLKTIRDTIIDMSALLLRGIEKEANTNVLSDIEKSKIKAEEDYLKDLEATVDGKPQGEFKDLEITEVTPEVGDEHRTAKERGQANTI